MCVCVRERDRKRALFHFFHKPRNLYFPGKYELRVDMEDFEGNQRYAEYKKFTVDDEEVTLANFVEMTHEGVHGRAAGGSVLQLLWRMPDYSADITAPPLLLWLRPLFFS